ncbi:39S ribosomal protein L34, mitochondrial [Hemicordylus capensis]|uniref:39S ribosomal protein L34, mitochondrial n=1 Tax=Hemicordylus capensis TaxID=884348 RepID=UPI0023029341|nr:39S ribosomal protein L34, mitochondrial [Hemicordylus capensis]
MVFLVGAAGGRSFLLMQRVTASILFQSRMASIFSPAWKGPLRPCLLSEPMGTCQSFPGPAMPWAHQQIRTKARGNEYQPSNIKRKRKHGWCKRIRERSGIEVILRRMLKGRKSLTH